jgi:hypothetical protein
MTKKEHRTQRKINELGTREAKCQICGQEDISMLATDKTRVTQSWRNITCLASMRARKSLFASTAMPG